MIIIIVCTIKFLNCLAIPSFSKMFHASKDRRDFIDDIDIAVMLYSIISSGILGLNSLGLISLKLSKSKTLVLLTIRCRISVEELTCVSTDHQYIT